MVSKGLNKSCSICLSPFCFGLNEVELVVELLMFESLFRCLYIHIFLGDFKEFIHLLFRWTHVFAGILWVGTTYYFTWLDGRFSKLETATGASPPEKNVWMVHSGGFYRVEKQTV